MPRRLVRPRLRPLLAGAFAIGVAGCAGTGDFRLFENRDQAFTKPLFETPTWAKASSIKAAPLTPNGPVGPGDLVDAAGRCAAAARAEAPPAEAQAPAAPASSAAPAAPPVPAGKPAYGSVVGDLASAPMPQGPPPAATPVSVKPSDSLDTLQPEGGLPPGAALGGIALGMTECQAVRRAGQPNNVSIGAGDKGVRKVVLTYLGGSWPGIYTFESGRLKEIDASAAQPKPQKPALKMKPKRNAPPKTPATERMYVQ